MTLGIAFGKQLQVSDSYGSSQVKVALAAEVFALSQEATGLAGLQGIFDVANMLFSTGHVIRPDTWYPHPEGETHDLNPVSHMTH